MVYLKRSPNIGSWIGASRIGRNLVSQHRQDSDGAGALRKTCRKLINEYQTHVHPVMPVCDNDEMCAALQKIRSADPDNLSEVKPVHEARQGWVLGAQAVGAFLIQDRERLPHLVNALHGEWRRRSVTHMACLLQ
eukprot:SAG31_NODE_834_length_11650_cov_7.572245_5_plen_135_part_00